MSWPSVEIINSRNDIQCLRAELDSLSADNDTIERAMCRFLVIRSCGYIELCVERGLLDTLAYEASPSVLSYVESGFFKGRNPKPGKIDSLLRSFRVEWAEEVADLLGKDDELLKRELEFLVSKRNSIAHGQSDSLGRRKALDLCDYAIMIGDGILEILMPQKVKPV